MFSSPLEDRPHSVFSGLVFFPFKKLIVPLNRQLRLNEWRCMEEGVEVMEPRKFKPSQRKCEEDEEDSSEQQNRNELHEIWELAAAMHCIRCFKSVAPVICI